MNVTVVTTMRNEGAHLLEWIAHHKAAGVSRFLVYVNGCEDGTEALLRLLPDVEVIAQDEGRKPPQWRALKAAWDHPAVLEADWVACLDCDEFINFGNGLRDITHLVETIGGDAILLPWRLFGANGQSDLSDALTLTRFTQAAPADMMFPPLGSFFKTLFRRAGPFRQLGVHRPKQKNPESHGVPVWHDGSGQRLAEPIAANDGQILHWGAPIARDLVQLNHYSLRSAADFLLKADRGLPNHRDKPIDLTYWVERNHNQVEERSIAPMLPATEAMLAELMALPGVAAAVAECRAWAASRFTELLRDKDMLALYGRLLLAQDSATVPRDVALRLVRAYGVAHGEG